MAKAAKPVKKLKKVVKKVVKKAAVKKGVKAVKAVKKAAPKKVMKKAPKKIVKKGVKKAVVKKVVKAVKAVKAVKMVKKAKVVKKSKPRAKKVTPVAKGYHNVTPYLIVNNGVAAIEFYKKAFGAKEMMRMEMHDGKIGHAELQMGDSKIMLADGCHEMHDSHSHADHCHGSDIGIHLYIKDVDAVVEKALSAGATLQSPVENMYYGDRAGRITDPFGHCWHIATHIEDVTPAQMRKRIAEIKAHCEAEADKA